MVKTTTFHAVVGEFDSPWGHQFPDDWKMLHLRDALRVSTCCSASTDPSGADLDRCRNERSNSSLQGTLNFLYEINFMMEYHNGNEPRKFIDLVTEVRCRFESYFHHQAAGRSVRFG